MQFLTAETLFLTVAVTGTLFLIEVSIFILFSGMI